MNIPPASALLRTITRWFACGLLLLLCLSGLAPRANGSPSRPSRSLVTVYPIPAEVRSTQFRVTLNGRSTEVMHAATGYYLLNFDTTGPVTVTVTSSDPHFWDAGVDIQPMRLGIRPVRRGATITFPMAGPSKLTVTRPGDHFADAQILFLFANPPDHSGITAQTPGVRYYAAGVHRENIDAHSGDTIYLAGGAVVFGSLNIWQVHDVRVLGTGAIIYDGPQNPGSDEGWMHKPNWHVVVMDNAHNIEIDGITCVTPSRSWQIQMRDSRQIGFYNVKAIAGNPNNANQDGMDWLGGGDTTVRNSFFRASDDVFAMYGNWDGYDPELMRMPGHDVTNITIEDSIASTSISNTVRVGWPEKTFNSAHFRFSDLDVIHSGYGGCKVPFAFFELWSDPGGRGNHTDYTFRNIRLDDWYSLFQIRQPNPAVSNITFQDIWALDGPSMVPSVITGDVSGVKLIGTSVEEPVAGEPVVMESVGREPVVGAAVVTASRPEAVDAHFTYSAGFLRPGQEVAFTAIGRAPEGLRYEWFFGDGTRDEGREVHHAFADAEGTLLDGTGRFRVLLHVVDVHGEQSWSGQYLVLLTARKRAGKPDRNARSGSPSGGSPPMAFERVLHIPADGGYTFTLLTSREGTMAIDDLKPQPTPTSRPQVCGSPGDAVQPVRVSVALKAGDHRLRIERKPGIENAGNLGGASSDRPTLLWEGPAIERRPIPGTALSYAQAVRQERKGSALPTMGGSSQ